MKEYFLKQYEQYEKKKFKVDIGVKHIYFQNKIVN